MSRRSILFLCCSVLCLAATACEKLDDARPLASSQRGLLTVQHAQFLDAIPAQYGDLISVTSNAQYPAWSQAWFEGPDKSITVVWVNASNARILDRVVTIPRR